MSQGVPSGLEGHIDSPNSLELLWERYRKWVILAVVAVVVAIGVNYFLRYQSRAATDSKWSGVLNAAGLDTVYQDIAPRPDQSDQFAQYATGIYLQQLRTSPVGDLPEHLRNADGAALASALVEARGDEATEPLLLWYSGLHAGVSLEFDEAEKHLNELKSKFPKHFLCQSSEFPPQWIAEKKDEDEEKDEPKARKDVEFEDPIAGSSVDRVLASLAAERDFRRENQRFFTAVEPTSKEFATITFEDPTGNFEGTVKLQFFDKQAPKHVEAFLAAVKEGFYDGMHIHSVEREPGQKQVWYDPLTAPSALKFGLPVTQEEKDRSKWASPEPVEEDDRLDWEESPELSHFPGTIAAEASLDGKSQIQRVVINGADVGASKDGSQVIFGRVVEGLDLIERIINEAEYRTEADNQNGRGIPSDDIKIGSITIE